MLTGPTRSWSVLAFQVSRRYIHGSGDVLAPVGQALIQRENVLVARDEDRVHDGESVVEVRMIRRTCSRSDIRNGHVMDGVLNTLWDTPLNSFDNVQVSCNVYDLENTRSQWETSSAGRWRRAPK